MRNPIFILIISFAFAQAYPGLDSPETRATSAARTRYSNTVNALFTKTSTGTTAVTKAAQNKTLTSIASIKTALDYEKLNMNTAKTQSTSVTLALNMGAPASSCETILESLMVCTGVLNTTIDYLAKLNGTAAADFQGDIVSTVRDIYTVYASLKLNMKAPSALYITTPDATYDLIGAIYNNVATTMNDMVVTYTQLLLIPAIVECSDYNNNGVTSNLSKIISSNNDAMGSSMIAAKSALTPYMTAISNVLSTVQNAITAPFGEIQEQALIIEQMCIITTTTTTTDYPDCTTPSRRSYESWGLGTIPSYCTTLLSELVQTFEDINNSITATVSEAVTSANSYMTNDLNVTFASINNTAANIESQLRTIFNSTECNICYPCANQTYVNLKNLVIQAQQSLVNCMAPISTNVQTNVGQILVDYIAAKDGVKSTVDHCTSIADDSDADCVINSTGWALVDVHTTAIDTSLGNIMSTAYKSCANSVQTGFTADVASLKTSFKTCSGLTLS